MAAVSFHSFAILSASPAINFRQSANYCLQKCNSSCSVLGSSTIGAVVRRESVHRALARDDYSINSPNSNDDPEAADIPRELQERDLTGTAYIPIYVMLHVCYDYMRSFRYEFEELLKNGVISKIEIGLGPRGELGYPSCPAKFGWKYPGIGEFQCYDKYLIKSLQKAAEAEGCYSLGIAPDYTGTYNSKPQETGFFHYNGGYYKSHGRFFLIWYSQVLIDHGDRVLYLAKNAFRRGPPLAAKLSVIYWWYNAESRAPQLTAGYRSPNGRCGYEAIASMLKKHEATLNLTCLELRDQSQQIDHLDASAYPEQLVWQIQHAAWDVKVPIVGENALPCYHRQGYNKIIDNAKPLDDPFGGHELSAFTYRRLSPTLLEKHNFMEFERFIQKMHGV